MTSTLFPAYKVKKGFMDSSMKKTPFWGANKAILGYCSSDGWVHDYYHLIPSLIDISPQLISSYPLIVDIGLPLLTMLDCTYASSHTTSHPHTHPLTLTHTLSPSLTPSHPSSHAATWGTLETPQIPGGGIFEDNSWCLDWCGNWLQNTVCLPHPPSFSHHTSYWHNTSVHHIPSLTYSLSHILLCPSLSTHLWSHNIHTLSHILSLTPPPLLRRSVIYIHHHFLWGECGGERGDGAYRPVGQGALSSGRQGKPTNQHPHNIITPQHHHPHTITPQHHQHHHHHHPTSSPPHIIINNITNCSLLIICYIYYN